MRCPRCGNENPEYNRYCGMCGTTLLPAPAPAAMPGPVPVTARPPARSAPQTPLPEQSQNIGATRTSAPVSDEPVISGPSFLGLNDPGPRKQASLTADPTANPSSTNLDYLLEDDEEHRRGGAGKFILILLALALAVGLGYLRWKNHGFGWLGSLTNKPSATAQNPEATDTTPAAQRSPSNPPVATAPATSQPAPDANSTAGAPTANPAGTPAGNSPAPNSPAATPPAPSATTPPAAPSADVGATPGGAAANPATGSANAPPPVNPDAAPASSDAPAAVKPQSNAPAGEPAPKPAAAVKPVDTVAEAQKYIYGRGVPQDCDRGLRLLRPAANRSSTKAMIEMGALYSAGLCTPRDLPTAYRWFALASRKEPDNQSVQDDLQKLWGEMTQPERQLAIKLSQ